MFAVVRHPDVAALGIVPAAALEHQRAQGWVRVSDYRPQPSDFHLPDFTDADEDLDAEAAADDETETTPAEDTAPDTSDEDEE